MPVRIDKPATAVQFVYRCTHGECGYEHRYHDVVRRHERDEHEIVLVRDESGRVVARPRTEARGGAR
ncbi:hypothetical protein [Bounagaea algeriensis]